MGVNTEMFAEGLIASVAHWEAPECKSYVTQL